METGIGRAGRSGIVGESEYELSALINIQHLGSLCDVYFKSYGCEVSDQKLWRCVVDLIHCTVSGTRGSDSHRWICANFNEGIEFIERFEKETLQVLCYAIPLWREYDPAAFIVSVESTLASTFIGFRKMFKDCNRTILDQILEEDRSILKRIEPIFEQDFVIDLTRTTYHHVDEQELSLLDECKVSWAYLIEECIRINSELRNQYPEAIRYTPDDVCRLIDVDELRQRFNTTSMCSRIELISDCYAADMRFDNLVVEFANIISRVIDFNSQLFVMIVDQLWTRAALMGLQGMSTFHCIDFAWMNKAAVVKIGCFNHGLFTLEGDGLMTLSDGQPNLGV